jgi:uncharacterized SAM-binding protein YcdF (DUF218 family)
VRRSLPDESDSVELFDDAAHDDDAAAGSSSRRRRWVPWSRLARTMLGLLAVGALYFVFSLGQVYLQGRRDESRPVDAIMVLGAAQWDGVPSPVLESRLSHALELWKSGIAPVIVVTGGKQPGDRTTEASVSADWLIARGVPDEAIRREVQGRNTWESIAASARFLKEEDRTTVVLVSDPYHAMRTKGIANEVGLTAHTSPTRTSPERQRVRHYVQEGFGVSVARFIGYRRLLRITG